MTINSEFIEPLLSSDSLKIKNLQLFHVFKLVPLRRCEANKFQRSIEIKHKRAQASEPEEGELGNEKTKEINLKELILI